MKPTLEALSTEAITDCPCWGIAAATPPCQPIAGVQRPGMDIELFTASDYAAEYGGKLTVVGVFDTLWADAAPIVHPAWSITVKARFEKNEEGPQSLRLQITDADGVEIVPPLDLQLEAQTPPDSHTGTFQVVTHLNGARFENFGEYAINLAINGRHRASIPLFVRQGA